jgi:flagellar basal-body rod modification protein FlgD
MATTLNNAAGVLAGSSAGSITGSTSGKTAADTSDRFLKLLVAQMQNQDPLNPMDNAQVTTQMAQIQTVSGIDKLDSTVKSLAGQFSQLQALSGAALVGRDVLIEGSNLMVDAQGMGHAGLELAGSTDRTQIEVLSGAGVVIDRIDLGALGQGRHSFEWTPSAGVDPAQAARFRIKATLGAAQVGVTPLQRDRVDAVSAGVDGLMVELAGAGPVSYDKIKVFD